MPGSWAVGGWRFVSRDGVAMITGENLAAWIQAATSKVAGSVETVLFV